MLIAVFQVHASECLFGIRLQSCAGVGKNTALHTWSKERRNEENFVTRDLITAEYIKPETGSDTASDADRAVQVIARRKQFHRRIYITVDQGHIVHAVGVEFTAGNQVKLCLVGHFHIRRDIGRSHELAVIAGYKHHVST